MFGRGAACASFKHSTAIHQRYDGQHFCTGIQLQYGEQVGEVIAQYIAGNRYGVFTLTNACKCGAAGTCRFRDLNVQTVGVVVFQVLFHLGDDLCIMRAILVQPEDGWSAGQACAGNSEFHPVLDGGIFGLAGTEDVALLDFLLQQNFPICFDNTYQAFAAHLEGFVM